MKKIGLFYGRFDPVSKPEIRHAVTKKKQLDLDEVWFVLSDEGIDFKHRLTLIKLGSDQKGFRVIRESELKKKRNQQYTDITDGSLAIRELGINELKLLATRQKRYIMDHYLYLESISKSALKERRWQHVQRVADLCVQFARGNHYDQAKAYRAGMLHDIAKNMDKQEQEWYVRTYCPELLEENWQTWHRPIAAVILKTKLKMSDRKIIRAVRHHCLGDDEDILSMIVYCADKLDPGRGYDSSRETALCSNNIKKGYALVKQQQYEYLKKEGVI